MIEVTRDPRRQLSKTCKGCQEPATCWLVVGDDNQRTVIAFCDDCAEAAASNLAILPADTPFSVTSVRIEDE